MSFVFDKTNPPQWGMTLPAKLTRDEVALEAMTGILSSLPPQADYDAGLTAKLAVEHADALLAELAKQRKDIPAPEYDPDEASFRAPDEVERVLGELREILVSERLKWRDVPGHYAEAGAYSLLWAITRIDHALCDHREGRGGK